MRIRKGDPQKERVYAAEAAAGFWEHEPFPDFDDLANWLCACMSSGLVEERYPDFMQYAPPDQKPGSYRLRQMNKNAKRSWANKNGIAIAPHHLYKHVGLHELAHVIVKRSHGRYVEGHGWQWCEVYLNLLGWFTTREIQARLREEFDARGVAYSVEQAVPDWKLRIVRAAA